MKGLVLREKPRGLVRTLVRLPIYLYRLDLGWLLGHRFLLVTHRGRRSGLLHQTVLEVLHYDPTTQESIVLAVLGERADWYRNIQAHPPLEVRTGHLRYVPQDIVPSSGGLSEGMDGATVRRAGTLGEVITSACG